MVNWWIHPQFIRSRERISLNFGMFKEWNGGKEHNWKERIICSTILNAIFLSTLEMITLHLLDGSNFLQVLCYSNFPIFRAMIFHYHWVNIDRYSFDSLPSLFETVGSICFSSGSQIRTKKDKKKQAIKNSLYFFSMWSFFFQYQFYLMIGPFFQIHIFSNILKNNKTLPHWSRKIWTYFRSFHEYHMRTFWDHFEGFFDDFIRNYVELNFLFPQLLFLQLMLLHAQWQEIICNYLASLFWIHMGHFNLLF